MRTELSSKDLYLQKLFPTNDPILLKIANKLKQDNKWGINIGGHELSILKFLIESFQVTSILEVGTLYAYSTYGMASYLPKTGRITSLEKNSDHFSKASQLICGSPHQNKINLINDDAKTYLQKCEEQFDFIFIDANKGGYLDYLELSLGLLRPGGLVLGDNTFLFGLVYGESGHIKMSDKNIEIMKTFNEKYIDHPDYTVTIIPTKEGMTLIKKN